MFSIQGQKCLAKKTMSFKKKRIQISLFINKSKVDKVNKLRYDNTARSGDWRCFFHLDIAKQVKSGNSKKSASKKILRTPTPTQSSGISYRKYEFEPPEQKATGLHLFSIGGKNRQKSSISRRRRSFKSEENTDRKSTISMRNRITMLDLDLDLPSIIRSKKVKKKCRYRPQLAGDIFSTA